MNKETVLVAYFSPAGSTRHVAAVIEKQFQTLGAEVSSFDLGESGGGVSAAISQKITASDNKSCLFIGSPVYVSRAAPRVMECIAGLKENPGAFAVPFVTWGGACSGISLYEMGKELSTKGFAILGAAKILAAHSLMWQLEDYLGKGHPDADDDRMVEELVNHVNQKLYVKKITGRPCVRIPHRPVHTQKATDFRMYFLYYFVIKPLIELLVLPPFRVGTPIALKDTQHRSLKTE